MERENIEKQLLEVEILKSIYSNLNEFVFEDEDAFYEAQAFLSNPNDKTLLDRKIGFKIKFNADLFEESKSSTQLPLEITCRLPTFYPLASPPDVFVRSLSINLSRSFSEELSNYVKSSHENDSAILNIIEWIKENVHRFLNEATKNKNSSSITEKENSFKVNEKIIFERIFIYSHHIYSTEKRKCIVNWAKEFKLTGFSMPGKPGIICIEGDQGNVQEYWARLKTVSWQRLQIKETQTYEIEPQFVDSLKKFDNFEEKMFLSNNDAFDLGLLFAFLKEKNLDYVFNLYFGVDGKLPSN